MNRLFLIFLIALSGCEIIDDLTDIEKIQGPCKIILTSGKVIEIEGEIKLSVRTQAITYRDEKGKLWSVFEKEYTSYSCGN
jgi:hypothetical protein